MANYAIAVHNTNSQLAVFSPNPEEVPLGVETGTSPAIAALPSGKWYSVFHSTPPQKVWFWENQSPVADGLGGSPDPNTGPAVAYAPVSGKVRIVFVSNGTLHNFEGDPKSPPLTEDPTGFGISPGTSPALATRSDGKSFVVAFSDTDCQLYLGDGPDQAVNTERPMMPKTSPSVATWAGEDPHPPRMIAYQTNEAFVSAWGTEDGTDWKFPMRSTSSPSVAAHQDGTWMVAFQANFGELQTITTNGLSNLGVHVRKDSSPAIAALSDGTFLIAYCSAHNGHLCTINPTEDTPEPTDLNYPMFPGSSPAIVGLS